MDDLRTQESIDNILNQWQINNPNLRCVRESIEIKHADPNFDIFTLYFSGTNLVGDSKIVKIKSIKTKNGKWRINHLK
jgi:hypothetical protein|tara:strand:- start:634 stop:867 length:234 start_codon:yes stop_codon:yes gene_type:complete